MSETGIRREPAVVAFELLEAAALDEAARAGGAELAPKWGMRRSLTAALEHWHDAGSLREDSLLLVEHLAVELTAYRYQQLGDQAAVQLWLAEFGDEVVRAQQHLHPAGSTAVEILAVLIGEGPAARGRDKLRLARIGGPYLLYVRDDHQVEDAREMALTFGMWAASELAQLLYDDLVRITAYTATRAAHAASSGGPAVPGVDLGGRPTDTYPVLDQPRRRLRRRRLAHAAPRSTGGSARAARRSATAPVRWAAGEFQYGWVCRLWERAMSRRRCEVVPAAAGVWARSA
ncbi:hypothetical protein ACIBEA_16640 [Streptomyces sp. NPDC051555]|uniref:hypothetical protein n=1 Tax=Streptomyces sp. NPDC051555 TaxID=3365657 RepID=UPI0037959B5D